MMFLRRGWFNSQNTCLIVCDVWPMRRGNFSQLKAVMAVRQNIARLISTANESGIAVWCRNSNLPFPAKPEAFSSALRATGAQFRDGAFQSDFNGWETFENGKQSYVKNVRDFRNYEKLVYAGFNLDECVASAPSGYVDTHQEHDCYLVYDAGLVNQVALPSQWERYPGKHPHSHTHSYRVAESMFFCSTMAIEIASVLSTDEFVRTISV